MGEYFLHGVEVTEIDDGIRPVRTVKSSIIGVIGTAPDANDTTFPLNTPVLLAGTPRAAADLGSAGTLKDALDGIFDQTGAMVVVVRVAEGASDNETLSNIIGDSATGTGVHAFKAAQSVVKVTPRILIAPGFTGARPVGVSTLSLDAAGSGYTQASVTISGGGGSGATATAIIEGGAITGLQLDRAGFGYTANPTIAISGDGSGAAATATSGATANPVVAELLSIAAGMRAVIIADGPNTDAVDAITYRQDWGSARVYVVDPEVMVWDTSAKMAVAKPASPRVAGTIARMDAEKGFWWSPSNQVLSGVVGISRPIDFALSNPNCAANTLNENEVATIIQQDGYRLWGNRTCSSDPLWAFLSVRRTHDMVNESIEQAFLWALDRPFSGQLLADIANSVNAYLRSLKARGALLGGKVWIDPELNTQERMMSGELYVDFDNEAPAPLEHLTFRMHRNSDYYEELLNTFEQG
jgi:phage tail sheath protein FI